MKESLTKGSEVVVKGQTLSYFENTECLRGLQCIQKQILLSGIPIQVFVNVSEQTLLTYLLKPMERVFAGSLSET